MTNEILVRRTVAIPGTRGPAGQIVDATAVPLNDGEQPTVTLGGTPEKRTMEFGLPRGPKGEKGDPGNGSVNSVNGNLGPDVVLGPVDVGGSESSVSGTLAMRGAGGRLPGVASPVDVLDAANMGHVEGVVDGASLGGVGGVAVSFDINAVTGGVGQQLNVPTHVTPSGGQVTHPSIVRFNEPWNGYRYWMAITPYPGGSDAHEDPNIVASNDGISWVVPAGLVNPLDDAPGSPQYNSDTDLVYAMGKLWCFWRYLDTGGGSASENIYVRTSTDGISWTAKELVYRSNMTTRRLVSPSLMYSGGVWTMYAVDVVNPSANKIVRLKTTGDSPVHGKWSSPTTCTISLPAGRVPWHIEVRNIGGKFYGLLNDCVSGQSGVDGNLYLIESANGTSFTRGTDGVIPKVNSGKHDYLYRATFCPEFLDGRLVFRVWYSAWMNPGGTQVWNLFRTVIGVPASSRQVPDIQHFTHVTPIQNFPQYSGHAFTVDFPRPFDSVPDVSVQTDSGRMNIAVTARTKTSFTFRADNWSNSGSNNIVLNCTIIAVAD